jgi:F-type H+-transporting ATPase subunit epsilon
VAPGRMSLRVLLPTHVEVDQEVDKIVVEAQDGAYCFLPRHVDFVAALAPGILSYVSERTEMFLAVNGGTVAKCGLKVMVSTPSAVRGADLGELRQAVEERFEQVGEREEQVRLAVHKMQADFVRRFIELEHG